VVDDDCGRADAPGLTRRRTSPHQAADAARRAEFACCYRHEIAKLVGFVTKIGATYQEAADAAQTAFLEMWRKWDSVDERRAWLRTVATRAYYRSIPDREVVTDNVPDYPFLLTPELQVVTSERTKEAHELLQILPPTQRLVMAWKADGFSIREIAHQLGCTESAVRQNLCRARTTLKERLKSGSGGGDA
jgi:RNA polymerase sigma factor (sigma-70 family)